MVLIRLIDGLVLKMWESDEKFFSYFKFHLLISSSTWVTETFHDLKLGFKATKQEPNFIFGQQKDAAGSRIQRCYTERSPSETSDSISR